jgi:hypothetical protein
MADDTSKIQGRYQTFLTSQDESSRFQNTDLPTSDSIRFIQFCALMGASEDVGGFGLDVFNTIADQAAAIMVSRNGMGREQVVQVSSAMSIQKSDVWRYGPQGRPAEEPEQKGRKK